jgi:hypothetical protein
MLSEESESEPIPNKESDRTGWLKDQIVLL